MPLNDAHKVVREKYNNTEPTYQNPQVVKMTLTGDNVGPRPALINFEGGAVEPARKMGGR